MNLLVGFVQILVMIISFTVIGFWKPNGLWWYHLILGFCISYWVTWGAFKIIDFLLRVRSLVNLVKYFFHKRPAKT